MDSNCMATLLINQTSVSPLDNQCSGLAVTIPFQTKTCLAKVGTTSIYMEYDATEYIKLMVGNSG